MSSTEKRPSLKRAKPEGQIPDSAADLRESPSAGGVTQEVAESSSGLVWFRFLLRWLRSMTISDKLALAAFIVSVLGIPASAWFASWYAVRASRVERVETRARQWYEAKTRFVNDLTDYGKLLQVVAKLDFGIDLNATNVMRDQNAVYEKIYEKAGDSGIYERIETDTDQLRDLGFDLFLKHHAPKAYDSLVLFRLRLPDPGSTNQAVLKGYLIGELLHNSGAGKSVAAISEEQLRSYLRSP